MRSRPSCFAILRRCRLPFLVRPLAQTNPHQLFGREAPEMFKYDEETNRLSLQPGKRAPWLRDETKARAERCKSWLYCAECSDRYFPGSKRASGHIPFRDRASQSSMRRPDDGEEVETQEEPEREPTADDQAPEADVQEGDTQGPPELPLQETVEQEDEDAHEEMMDPLAAEDVPEPVDRKWPTLAEYQEKWDQKLAYHMRANPGEFSTENLVPQPVSQLWQEFGGSEIVVAGKGMVGMVVRACRLLSLVQSDVVSISFPMS